MANATQPQLGGASLTLLEELHLELDSPYLGANGPLNRKLQVTLMLGDESRTRPAAQSATVQTDLHQWGYHACNYLELRCFSGVLRGRPIAAARPSLVLSPPVSVGRPCLQNNFIGTSVHGVSLISGGGKVDPSSQF